MCDCPSILDIKIGKVKRDGEQLLMPVRLNTVCHDCEKRDVDNILVVVPCSLARDKSPQTVRSYVGNKTLNLLTNYGPISFQRLTEAISDSIAKVDLKQMAGEILLNDMPIKGRA